MTYQRKEVIGDCTLYLGDCMEILPTLDKVDAVVTDPPYGIGFKYGGNFSDTEAAFHSFMQALAGFPLALLQYPEEMMRLVCPVLGAPQEVMAWVYNSNLPRQTRLWGFWGCDVLPSRSKQDAKNADCAKVKDLRVSGYDWRNIPQVKNTSADKTEHPCQLPAAVAEWVLECMNHEVVLDPFMGSGTTGVACVNLGRKFIGIELEPKYFDIACERIQRAYDQPRLFDEPAPEPEQEALL